jgi:hypothetical protein
MTNEERKNEADEVVCHIEGLIEAKLNELHPPMPGAGEELARARERLAHWIKNGLLNRIR